MTSYDVFDKLEKVERLPSLPAVIQRLRSALEDPNADYNTITNIMKDDPAMVANIMQLVNSAVYGLPQRVKSVSQAVSILGVSAVGNIALSAGVFSSFKNDADAEFSRNEFWSHSISVGIGMNVVYEKSRSALSEAYSSDVLHLTGLLHDMGKMVMDEYFHAEFMGAIARARQEDAPLYQAEREMFETDHAEIGAWLAERWQLDPEVVETIRWHHDPDRGDKNFQDLHRLCHIANHICNLRHCGDGGDTVAPVCHMGTLKKLGLGVKDIEPMVNQVREEAKRSETMLSLAT